MESVVDGAQLSPTPLRSEHQAEGEGGSEREMNENLLLTSGEDDANENPPSAVPGAPPTAAGAMAMAMDL
jgi:hypothetical protein